MTTRYSGKGSVRIGWNDRAQNYDCSVTDGTSRVRMQVGTPAGRLDKAIDAPESFDAAARAAISFATNWETTDPGSEPLDVNAFAMSADGNGWHVGRKPTTNYPKI